MTTKTSLQKVEIWWKYTDFNTMEIITGFSRFDYSDEDGYQDFVDACDEWWDCLSENEKIDIYEEFAD